MSKICIVVRLFLLLTQNYEKVFKWHSYPFVRLVIPLIIGILLSRFYELTETSFCLIAILCVALSCFLFFLHFKHSTPLRTILYGNVSSFLFIGIGLTLTYINNEIHRVDYFGKLSFDAPQPLVGEITDITPTASNLRLNVAVSGVVRVATSSPNITKASGNLLVYTTLDSNAAYKVGQKLLMDVKPNLITSLHNPFEFDFEKYWHSKNVHYQCFVKSEGIKIIDSSFQNNIRSASMALQTALSNWLQPYLQTPNEFYVGTALMLGAKNTEAQEIKNAYIQTGAMHILAVSGMHVMLLWLALKRVLSVFIKNKRVNIIVGTVSGLIVIWLFACVTGLGASVLRATVMATFLGLGELSNRKANAVNMLAASSFLLLLIDPNFLFDIGFQFSYLAVLGIVVWYPYIFNWFFFHSLIQRFFWEITALGLAAQILVTPLSLLYFHRFATYFWLTGLLAIPVSTVALYAGLLVFLFHPIQPLAWCAGKVFYFCVWLMNAIILKTEELPFGAINGIFLSEFSVVLIYAIIFFVFVGIFKKTLGAWQPALVFILVLTSLSASKFQAKPSITVCIYNTPNKTLVDVFSDEACLTITDIDTTNVRQLKQLNRATHNFREYKNVQKYLTTSLDDSIFIKNMGYSKGVLLGLPERWLIVAEPIQHFPKIKIDNIVLSDKVEVSLDSIQKYFSPKRIIIDVSKKNEELINGCKRLNLNYHDIKTQGAFLIDY